METSLCLEFYILSSFVEFAMFGYYLSFIHWNDWKLHGKVIFVK